jgi:hypothetical protein
LAPRAGKRAADAVHKQVTDRGIFRVDHYLTWKKGDFCGITGEAGVFVFLSARFEEGVCVSVDVHGGPSKQEMMRAFDPHRLTTKFAKTTRRKKKHLNDAQGRLL